MRKEGGSDCEEGLCREKLTRFVVGCRSAGQLLAAECAGRAGRERRLGEESDGDEGLLPPGGVSSATLQGRQVDHCACR